MLATTRVGKNREKEGNENFHNIIATAITKWISKSGYTAKTNFLGQDEWGS